MWKAAALLFGVSLLAVPAIARDSIQYVTVTGTVSSGTDGTGAWGGGDLAGDPFTLLFTLNLSHGNPYSTATGFYADPSTLDILYQDGASGPGSVNLMIGGKSQTLLGSATYKTIGDDNDFGLNASISESFISSDGSFLTNVNVPTWPFGSAFSAYRTVLTPLDLALPQPAFFAFPPTGSFSLSEGQLTSNAVFDLSGITISATVPESGTWSLLLFGFGMLGTMFRSRTKSLFRV